MNSARRIVRNRQPVRTRQAVCRAARSRGLPVLGLLTGMLSLMPHAAAQTYVSGPVLEDTTWKLAGSPYILTGLVHVYEDATLTIEAGVVVEGIASTRSIRVGSYSSGGRLSAAEVVFDGGPDGEIWIDATGSAELTRCEFGDLCVKMSSSAVTIDESLFTGPAHVYVGQGAPTIAKSTFEADLPAICPANLVPGFETNHFLAPDSKARIWSMHVTQDTNWRVVENLVEYEFGVGVYVDEGSTLTIGDGVVVSGIGIYDELKVRGTIVANGCTFRADSAGGPIEFDSSTGTGTFTNCDFDGVHLDVPYRHITVCDSTFRNCDTPLGCRPNLLTGMETNTFLTPDSTVLIYRGALDQDTTWGAYGGISEYEIDYADVYIMDGATLTVPAGITVNHPWSHRQIYVGYSDTAGHLQAFGATFQSCAIGVSPLGTATVEGCTFRASNISLNSDANVIRDCEFNENSRALTAAHPVISGNTFAGTAPLTCLFDLIPDLTANTFLADDAAVTLDRGTITADLTWPMFGNVRRYQIANPGSVESGATLTITSGLTISGGGSVVVGTDESVGMLVAEGVTFADCGPSFGEMGRGVLVGCTFTGGAVRVDSSEVLIQDSVFANDGGYCLYTCARPMITSCVFTTNSAAWCLPELFPGFTTNTFTAPESTIWIAGGTVTADARWPRFAPGCTYHLRDSLSIANDLTLSIDSGVTVSNYYMASLYVGTDTSRGYLRARRVALPTLRIGPEGRCVLDDCSMQDARLRLEPDTVEFRCLSLLGETVVEAWGDRDAMIDLRGVFWDTTDLDEIERRIIDHDEDGWRPSVVYWPILEEPCVFGDLNGDGAVDFSDFLIESWCMSGPAQPAVPGCEVADLDADLDADLRDLAVLQAAFGATGP